MRIELCMGSSCFARGNSRLLHILEDLILQHEHISIDLSGHLCLGDCSNGPNIRIDGTIYQGLAETEIITIIENLIEKGTSHET